MSGPIDFSRRVQSKLSKPIYLRLNFKQNALINWFILISILIWKDELIGNMLESTERKMREGIDVTGWTESTMSELMDLILLCLNLCQNQFI